ncbi:hypothetical protein BpHYR1_011204 [Brachionus plicatilis]|uniref:Uncharacterized protein n=1 Tax=Brachionus plicatilis TaxID=10195 RepID=A0A3M7SNK1_BRAPC|nr:hypothetical protein BpHYR1_011204 [Brachionus plicatilis]
MIKKKTCETKFSDFNTLNWNTGHRIFFFIQTKENSEEKKCREKKKIKLLLFQKNDFYFGVCGDCFICDISCWVNEPVGESKLGSLFTDGKPDATIGVIWGCKKLELLKLEFGTQSELQHHLSNSTDPNGLFHQHTRTTLDLLVTIGHHKRNHYCAQTSTLAFQAPSNSTTLQSSQMSWSEICAKNQSVLVLGDSLSQLWDQNDPQMFHGVNRTFFGANDEIVHISRSKCHRSYRNLFCLFALQLKSFLWSVHIVQSPRTQFAIIADTN